MVPIAQLSNFQTETAVGGDADGLGCTGDVFTAADAPVRVATHKMGNGTVNAAQLALLTSAAPAGWGQDVNGYSVPPASCPGAIVKVYDLLLTTSSAVQQAMLADNGLTLNSGA